MARSSRDLLLSIAKRHSTVDVVMDGETITLQKPDAATYQRLAQMAIDMGGGSSKKDPAVSDAIDLHSECLAAAVPDMTLEEARDTITMLGMQSPLAKAAIGLIGIIEPEVDVATGN